MTSYVQVHPYCVKFEQYPKNLNNLLIGGRSVAHGRRAPPGQNFLILQFACFSEKEHQNHIYELEILHWRGYLPSSEVPTYQFCKKFKKHIARFRFRVRFLIRVCVGRGCDDAIYRANFIFSQLEGCEKVMLSVVCVLLFTGTTDRVRHGIRNRSPLREGP